MKERKGKHPIKASEKTDFAVKEISAINRQHVLDEEIKYRKYMCKNCIHFKDSACIKGRQATICAEKGLKNK